MKKEEIEKYKLLDESLEAISKNVIKLLIIKGQSGFGKTYTTLKYAKENKLNYKYINNYSTPLAFYKLLYKNRKRDVIIFDDIQGMSDLKVISLFKSACWESENSERVINYYSTSSILKKENLPTSFVLKSNIILIFNEEIKGFESIIDRGVMLNFKFSFKEKLEIIEHFKKESKIDDEVFSFIKKNYNSSATNLSLRNLIILSNLKKEGYDFKSFAKEMIFISNPIKDLIKMSEKEWCNKTGKHRATYYRNCKKYNISK